jgi:hypothetical protein
MSETCVLEHGKHLNMVGDYNLDGCGATRRVPQRPMRKERVYAVYSLHLCN